MPPRLLISAGLPKSGSTWLFRMQQDLLGEAGWTGGGQVGRAFFPEDSRFPYVATLGPLQSAALLCPVLAGHSYVVKVHCGPTPATARLIGAGLARATVILRDPRDCVLSCLDEGRRARAEGNRAGQIFAELDSLEKALRYIAGFRHAFTAWAATPGVHFVRYEEMMADPVAELEKQCRYLGVAIPDEALREIAARYRDGRKVPTFNIGGTGRHRDAFRRSEIAMMDAAFGPWLKAMGYAP